MSRHRFAAIDVFCGCGGLTTGLEAAGFEVVGAIDNDALAIESYHANHPKVRVWKDDVAKVTSRAISRALGVRKGELDLIAGCPPCQGFSTLRTLNGGHRVRDSQNELIFELLRLIIDLRPKSIMLENVPALAHNRRLGEFLRSVKSAGYAVGHKVVDASDFGVPQRRRRLILLGSLLGPVAFPPPSRQKRTVRHAIECLPPPRRSKDPLHRLVGEHSQNVQDLIRRIPKNGGSRTDIGAKELLDCHKRTDGFYDVYGRMPWDDVAPTITTGCVNPSRGRFLHPRQNRAISLREAALLQSFPARYSISLKDGKYAAARLIGNALPPELVRRHALSVRHTLEKDLKSERVIGLD